MTNTDQQPPPAGAGVELARLAYEARRASHASKHGWDNAYPAWEDVPEAGRSHWRAAAQAVVDAALAAQTARVRALEENVKEWVEIRHELIQAATSEPLSSDLSRSTHAYMRLSAAIAALARLAPPAAQPEGE